MERYFGGCKSNSMCLLPRIVRSNFSNQCRVLNIGVVVIESRSIRYTDLVPLMPLILSAVERTRAGEVSVVSDQSRGPAEVGQGR